MKYKKDKVSNHRKEEINGCACMCACACVCLAKYSFSFYCLIFIQSQNIHGFHRLM